MFAVEYAVGLGIVAFMTVHENVLETLSTESVLETLSVAYARRVLGATAYRATAYRAC